MKRSQRKAEAEELRRLEAQDKQWQDYNVEVNFTLKYHQLVAARNKREASSCVQTLVQRKFRELSGNCDKLTFRINAKPIEEEIPEWKKLS